MPPSIPDHELIRCIGRGSYGDVWLARNVFGQFRAVKIIHRGRFPDPRPFEREFEGIQRFEPISRSHPSQLHILHVGKNDAAGCFFYVMELADDSNEEGGVQPVESGGPNPDLRLDSSVFTPHSYSPRTLRWDLERRNRLPPADCVQIGLSLATALQHLHENKLVHRDIKPSNILFVHGVAKLGDIGLVTDAGDTQSIVGTEGYLPPEGPGTPQADLYSLGKVLYEISTGMDRRRFAELPEDMQTWREANAVSELNAIALKLCAKDPLRRYASAEALRADLELLQRGKSVKAVRHSEQLWNKVWKAAMVAGLAALLAVALVAATRRAQPPANVESRFRSTNVQASDFYDVGRAQYLRNTNVFLAAEWYQAAVGLDPNFGLAWAAMAAAWSWGGTGDTPFPHLHRVPGAAERALRLSDELAEAHLALAWHAFIREWDWPKAETRFQKAIRCDPSNPQSHEWYGLFLRSVGRPQDALREFELAVRLNPQSLTASRFLVNGLISVRRCEDAIAAARKAEQLADANRFMLLNALEACGRFEEWIALHERMKIAEGADASRERQEGDALRQALAQGGSTAFWSRRLETLKKQKSDALSLASVSACAGRVAEALDFLDQAHQAHDDFLVWDLATHPQWDNLRGHPRFRELLRKLNLPLIEEPR